MSHYITHTTCCNDDKVIGLKGDKGHWKLSEVQLQGTCDSMDVYTYLQVRAGIWREEGKERGRQRGEREGRKKGNKQTRKGGGDEVITERKEQLTMPLLF